MRNSQLLANWQACTEGARMIQSRGNSEQVGVVHERENTCAVRGARRTRVGKEKALVSSPLVSYVPTRGL